MHKSLINRHLFSLFRTNRPELFGLLVRNGVSVNLDQSTNIMTGIFGGAVCGAKHLVMVRAKRFPQGVCPKKPTWHQLLAAARRILERHKPSSRLSAPSPNVRLRLGSGGCRLEPSLTRPRRSHNIEVEWDQGGLLPPAPFGERGEPGKQPRRANISTTLFANNQF